MTTTEQQAWPHTQVAAFERRRDDVLVVDRDPIPGVAESLATARFGEWRSEFTADTAADLAAEGLASLGIDHPELAADVAAVARGFLEQFGGDVACLRVEVLDRVSCPKWHTDRVTVRLVTTYNGAGTEFARTDAPGVVHQAPAFALVFLKGTEHPTHADEMNHRSPPVAPGEKRLCVVVNH